MFEQADLEIMKEVLELTTGAVMHEGLVSLVPGPARNAPRRPKTVMMAGDIILAEATGGRIHVMHLSTAGSVELVRRAKRRGVRVTTEGLPSPFHAYRRMPAQFSTGKLQE